MSDNNIELEAARWLARLEQGQSSSEVKSAFAHWKAADERHGAAYVRLSATWQALDRLRVLDLAPCAPSVHLTKGSGRLDPLKQRSLAVWSIAVAVILVVAGVRVLIVQLNGQVYSTARGGFQRILLSDQSTVELNTDTTIRVEMTSKLRKIILTRGEASFEVAHDAPRPFVVSTGSTAVLAVGTRFNVRKFDTAVEVAVDEGKVLVDTPEILEHTTTVRSDKSPLVAAGQVAVTGKSGIHLMALPADAMARKLAWQNQMLAFDNEPLSNVVTLFNRYNTTQLIIADPQVAALRIGGYFKSTNVDEFVKVLASDFAVQAQAVGSYLILQPSVQK